MSQAEPRHSTALPACLTCWAALPVCSQGQDTAALALPPWLCLPLASSFTVWPFTALQGEVMGQRAGSRLGTSSSFSREQEPQLEEHRKRGRENTTLLFPSSHTLFAGVQEACELGRGWSCQGKNSPASSQGRIITPHTNTGQTPAAVPGPKAAGPG